MNKVPNMISTKDLSYLKDMYEWNFNASKLAYSFSSQVKSENVKEMIMKVCRMHSENCRKIKTILTEGYNEQ